jgi:hypothetical protein
VRSYQHDASGNPKQETKAGRLVSSPEDQQVAVLLTTVPPALQNCNVFVTVKAELFPHNYCLIGEFKK